MQSVETAGASQWLALVFEITRWRGEIQPDDPDNFTLEAAFVRIDDAITRLKQLRWPAMSAPIVAYL